MYRSLFPRAYLTPPLIFSFFWSFCVHGEIRVERIKHREEKCWLFLYNWLGTVSKKTCDLDIQCVKLEHAHVTN